MSEMSSNHIEWLRIAKKKGAYYVLDVWDTFSNEHYPVYVLKKSEMTKIAAKYNNKEMQKVEYTINVEKGKII